MCLVVWANNVVEEFPFVMASNRDEALRRPTTAPVLDRREGANHREVLAGWDGQSGGTWMALNTRTGVLATLTNYGGEPTQADQKSRGAVASSLVSGEQTHAVLQGAVAGGAEEQIALESLVGPVDVYSGFNTAWAVLGSANKTVPVWSSSNRHPETLPESERTPFHPSGIRAISNGFRSTRWDKMAYVEHGLGSILNSYCQDAVDVPSAPGTAQYTMQDPGSAEGRFRGGEVKDGPVSGVPPPRVAGLALRLGQLMCSDRPELQDERASTWRAKMPGLGGMLTALANVFVRHESYPPGGYGTRSQTLVIQDRAGTVHYFYRTTMPSMEAAWSYWSVAL